MQWRTTTSSCLSRLEGWPARIEPGGLGLASSHSVALAQLLPLLLCGEESAVLAFAHQSRASSWGARVREDFLRMEFDEARHAHWLRRLQDCLPTPEVDLRDRRRAKRFFLALGHSDLGIHLGQVAALDSAVCLILGRLRRSDVCKSRSPVGRVFASIHGDEARHVAISRDYASQLCSTGDLLTCAAETREQLVELLSGRAQALDALGICPDSLFRQLRTLPRRLFK